MKFHIIDTESIYRRLLNAPDNETRQAIYQTELIAPFAGLTQFFGTDNLSLFRQWGMPLELYTDSAQLTPMLEAMSAFGVWDKAVQALNEGWAAFAPYADQISTQEIVFGLMITQSLGMPVKGYAGFGAIPPWIMTTLSEANDYTLPRIATATAHELHHNLAGAINGRPRMIATLGDYIVGEGLAESFGVSLYGEDTLGYYVTDFDESRLDDTLKIIGENLGETDFNKMRGFVFGGPMSDVPTYAGYAIGYRVVQAYMKHTGKSVVETTFVPAHEVIAQSHIFAGIGTM